jgi:catechol 2,3-dioxygenase-like lactoylglutathione lyase family enzyme
MTDRPVPRWVRVTLDCDDAESLARFYADLFGWHVSARDGRGWVQVQDPAGGVGLNFQAEPNYLPPTWPETPAGQGKMMHFEVLVSDLPSAVDAVLRAGGTEAAFQPPDRNRNRLRVMLDPAGHPFCLFVEGE